MIFIHSVLVRAVVVVYSDDPSSIPAGYLKFLYEKKKINEKEARVGPSLKKIHSVLVGHKLPHVS